MFITVGRKDIAIGPRGRLATAGVVSALLHVVMFWALINTRYREPPMPYDDTQPTVEVQFFELVKPVPPPEPQPVVELKPHEIQQQTEPEPQPEQVQEAEPASQPDVQIRAKSVQEVALDRQPAAKQVQQQQLSDADTPMSSVIVPMPSVRAKAAQEVAIQKQAVKQMAQQQLSDADTQSPSLAPTLSPGISAKKKKEDEEQNAIKAGGGAKALTEFALHQPPGAPPALAASGDTGGGAPPGGGMPSGMPSAGQLANQLGGGKSGVNGGGLKGGRGKLTQAMQNHDYCNDKVKEGETVPANCEMDSLNGQDNLGLKKDKVLQAAAAQRDADLRYKTSPGSPDSWNTAMRQPSDPPNKDDQPKYGDYSSGKRQRVVGQCGETASCTSDGSETRRPGDPKPGG